jgi:hypothetical protein
MQLSKASGEKIKHQFLKLTVYKILVLNAAGAHHLHVQGYGQECAPECAMELILIFISSS